MTDQSRHPTPVPEDDSSDHPLLGRAPMTFDQPTAETASGLRMPRLGLGTWRLDDGVAETMVGAALDLGYRHIDTAQMYGNEAAVGRAVAGSSVDRASVFLTTKIDNDRHEPDDLVRSVDQSLERLGTDHVDLLLLHWPVRWDIIGATMAALAQVQASGRADHIGVSNFTVEQLDQVHGQAPIEVLQVECHPFLQQRRLRQWCADHDLLLTAYSPLAKGSVIGDPTLERIGERHEASAAQVALAWLTGLDGVVAIPRTADADHLQSNWRAGELQLSDEERAEIDGLDAGRRQVDPEFAPWTS